MKIPMHIRYNLSADTIVPFLLMMLLFSAYPPWILWAHRIQIYVGLLSILLAVLLRFQKVLSDILYKYNAKVLCMTCFFVLYFVLIRFLLYQEHEGFKLYIIIVAMTITVFPSKDTSKALELFTKAFAALLIISLFAWLIHKYLFPIPTYAIYDLRDMKSDDAFMHNHIFFVTFLDRTDRFYSVFDEPGVVGTIGAIMLYANKYNFKKWYNVAILIGCIPTYSLAFVILLVFGLALFYSKDFKALLKGIVLTIILVCILFCIFKDNSTFQSLITSRLKNSASISANARTSETAINSFYKLSLYPKYLLFGYGFNPDIGAFSSNSYVNWILEYGFLGLIVMFFLYYSMIKKKNRYSIGAIILLFISFLQRPDILDAGNLALLAMISDRFSNGSLHFKSKGVQKYISAITFDFN